MLRSALLTAAAFVTLAAANADPIILGHRGATGYRPEHTIASYKLAVEMGADFIEPDLVSTKDGVLVVRHEPNITETTDVANHPEFASRKTTKVIDGESQTGWFADDFTLAEIKTLRAKERLPFRDHSYDGKFEVLTFQEVIDIAKSESAARGRVVGIIPETKHPSYFRAEGLPLEEKMLAQLNAAGWKDASAPVIIQSFEVGNLKRLHQQTSIRLMQLTDAQEIKPDGTIVYNQPADFVLSGDKRTYDDLLTPAGLKEIATYAWVLSPYKRSIVSVRAKEIGADGKPVDQDGDGKITEADTVTLPPSTLVADAHKVGLKVMPYTFRAECVFLAADYACDVKNEMRQFFAIGVDGLFTDNADKGVAAKKP